MPLLQQLKKSISKKITLVIFSKNIFIEKGFVVKSLHIDMFDSNKLNNLKTIPKISLRARQAAAATPTTPATEENNEGLIETIRKIVREELEDHQEKVKKIIKSQLTNTNERLDNISQEVVDITKSPDFTLG